MRYKLIDNTLPDSMATKEIGNAGYDLYARLDAPVTLYQGETAMIPLNLVTEIPTGMVGLMFQRSSTFKTWGIRLTNNVGVVDSTYCGDNDEWKAHVQNMTGETVTIKHGDKICQALFMQLPYLPLEKVESMGNTDRGGFGTTGTGVAK